MFLVNVETHICNSALWIKTADSHDSNSFLTTTHYTVRVESAFQFSQLCTIL